MSNPSIYSGTFTSRTNLPASQLSAWQLAINNHDHGPTNGGNPVSLTAAQVIATGIVFGSSILSGDGSGGFTNVTIGTGLSYSGTTLKVGNGLGAWTSVNAGQIYMAATDLTFQATVLCSANQSAVFYSDSINGSTTLRAQAYLGAGGTAIYAPITSRVRKGDYYQLSLSGATVVVGPWIISEGT